MRDILQELANFSDASIDTPTPGPDTTWRKHGMDHSSSQPGSTTDSPRDMSLTTPHSQTKRPDNPAIRAEQDSSRSRITPSQAYIGNQLPYMRDVDPSQQPNSTSPPWWMVSNDNGMQGLEGAVGHPLTASGLQATSTNGFGQISNLPTDFIGSIPPTLNVYGREQPNADMVGQGFQPTDYDPRSVGNMMAPGEVQPAEFWSMQPGGNAMEMSGVLADIWSMAPSTFE
jgi:hypothetical protein